MGWQAAAGHYPFRVRRQEISVDTLRVLSDGLNSSVLEKLRPHQVEDLERETWQETQKKLHAGWVWVDEASDVKGKIVGFRFSLHQGLKTRVIDDLSICKLNATVGEASQKTLSP